MAKSNLGKRKDREDEIDIKKPSSSTKSFFLDPKLF
jgi:hypothetical protein